MAQQRLSAKSIPGAPAVRIDSSARDAPRRSKGSALDFQRVSQRLEGYESDGAGEEGPRPAPMSPKRMSHVYRKPSEKAAEVLGMNGPSRPRSVAEVRSSISLLWQSWWVECLGCVLCAVSFIAIVVTLAHYQSKEAPHLPLNVSLNTLISILTVFFKASLLLVIAAGIGQLKWHWLSKEPRPLYHIQAYDESSRGPWGSLKLLWLLRGRQFTASLGAVVTVLALATDPFNQAVLRFYACSVPTNPPGDASISRSNIYSSYGISEGSSNGSSPEIPLALRGYIDMSLYSSRSVEASFSCPSGNCAFEKPFLTVGYCSRCQDATDSLDESCNIAENGLETCTYSLPGSVKGQTIRTKSGSSANATDSSPGSGQNQTFSMVSGSSDGDNGEGRINAAMISLTEPVQAFTCDLRLCVKTLQSSIQNGHLVENLLSSNDKWSQGSSISNTVNLPCLDDKTRKSLQDSGYDLASNNDWLAWNGNGYNASDSRTPDPQAPQINIPQDCLFQYSSASSAADQQFFSDRFNGTLPENENGVVSRSLQALWNSGNVSMETIESAFDRISGAMTAFIREAAPEQIPNATGPSSLSNLKQESAQGTSLESSTCIHVRWAWLALPAALLAMTIIFFICIIAHSVKDRHEHVWKSSQMALLFHGIEGIAGEEGAELQLRDDMEYYSKEVNVELEATEQGWKLIQR